MASRQVASGQIARIIKSAEHSCDEAGVRLTEKRKKVLTTLLKSKSPLSAYETAELYKDNFDEHIPAMSVYRMLDFMVEKNLVHKLSTINKYVACAHIACDHAHEIPQFLICDDCESVKEIGVKKEIIDALRNSLKKADFSLGSPQLELHGTCKDCESAKR